MENFFEKLSGRLIEQFSVELWNEIQKVAAWYLK